MPRTMPAGALEAINRPDAQIEEHSTLELLLFTGAEIRGFHFATAELSLNGVLWAPAMRQGGDIGSSLTDEADNVTVELQNVDTLLGIQFADLERILDGAEANVGRYWKDLQRGDEWHDIFLKGLVDDVSDNEMVVRLQISSDIYSGGVSVGPLRRIRRLCQARPYKGFECGSVSTLPTCAYTLGDCELRHPNDDDHLARFMGMAFLDNQIFTKII